MRERTTYLQRLACVVVAVMVLTGHVDRRAFAQALYFRASDNEPIEQRHLVVPYAFSTEDLGAGFGLGYAGGGWPQPQALTMATLFGSQNESKMGLAMGLNWRAPGTDRLFLSPFAMVADWTELRVYAGINPEFPGEIPGANDSSEANFLQDRVLEAWTYVDFKYVLPLGHGKEHPVSRYLVRDGLAVGGESGGTALHPGRSGRTYVRLRPEYRSQRFDPGVVPGFDNMKDPTTTTLNYRLSLEYDNRDFYPNPTRGGHFEFGFMHDPELLNDTPDEWVVIDADLSAYFALPKPRGGRQSVLALNFWTADTPTWREDNALRGVVDGAPPYYRGATLGGYYRLKAFPTGRFNGKSAVYYGGEYRLLPVWQPLPKVRCLRALKIKWWQFVVIGELGRVSDHYHFKELHRDMKWDVGGGVNVMFGTGIGRLHLVTGDEGMAAVAMAGQTF